MCGIAGIISPDKSVPIEVQLQNMMDIIEHRGPDDEGKFVDRSVGLGHRRLSIIDLSNGKQPMANSDKTLWISYNGEVYNFLDIRKILEKKGHVFLTNCDTEVILHAYEEYGDECVRHFRGMFAFAIWDTVKQRMFLARDRLGKKPLYYYYDGKKIVFSSEIKAIMQAENIPKKLDMSSLKDYFTYLYIPFPKTIFRRIFKLPPAHTLSVQVFQNNKENSLKLKTVSYWDLSFEVIENLSEKDWMEKLEAKIIEAIKIRMISDVPLGAFLSGGIDSSSVVAMMSQVVGQPVKTFSIGFEESDFSELKYAREIATRYGTDHKEIILKPDVIQTLQRLAWQFDEPFADPSSVPTYHVSMAAREYVTVILSGDGGDEGFAGYGRYANYFKYKKLDIIPLKIRAFLFGKISEFMPLGMKGKGILRHLSRPPFYRYAGMVTHTFPGYLENLFHDNIKSVLKNCEEDYRFLKFYFDIFLGKDELSQLQYLDIKTYLAEDILTKVDRASMLCSLETRAPLLDHELLEIIASMPSDLCLRNGEKKYILKKIMGKYLPESILYRKKMGFDMPSSWFKKEFLDYSKDLLLSEKSINRGIINPIYIENILESSIKKGRNLISSLWSLVFFEEWCRNWLD